MEQRFVRRLNTMQKQIETVGFCIEQQNKSLKALNKSVDRIHRRLGKLEESTEEEKK